MTCIDRTVAVSSFIAQNRALGRFHLEIGRHDEATRSLESARDAAKGLFGEEHHVHLDIVAILSDAYVTAGRTGDAVQLLEQTHQRLQAKLQTFDVRIMRVALELARAALEGGDIRRAETLAQQVESAAVNAHGKDSQVRALALATRGRSLYLTQRAAEAEPLVREAVTILAARHKDDWQTHEVRLLLGLTLVAQGKLTEAEPELAGGYAGLKGLRHRLLHVSRRRMGEALDALAQGAEKLERPADAARWRAEREKIR